MKPQTFSYLFTTFFCCKTLLLYCVSSQTRMYIDDRRSQYAISADSREFRMELESELPGCLHHSYSLLSITPSKCFIQAPKTPSSFIRSPSNVSSESPSKKSGTSPEPQQACLPADLVSCCSACLGEGMSQRTLVQWVRFLIT